MGDDSCSTLIIDYRKCIQKKAKAKGLHQQPAMGQICLMIDNDFAIWGVSVDERGSSSGVVTCNLQVPPETSKRQKGPYPLLFMSGSTSHIRQN
jgi:hypothetical protein